MAQALLAPIFVRPARWFALLLPALILSMAFGCSHSRRSSLRPVYVGPARPCPGGDCGSTVGPSTTSPSSSSTTVAPSVIEPLNEPPLGSSPATLSSPAPASSVLSTPSRSSSIKDTPPAVMAPVPGFPDEPDLTPVGGEQDSKVPSVKGTTKGAGAGAIKGSGLSSPTTSSRNNSPRSSEGRLRQTSLSEQLRPYVNDADDLFSPPKADRPWKYIVLHHSANPTGGYDSIDREHRKRLGWNGCGYHFVIGNGTETPDGQVEVAQRWTNQKHGVHCRDGKNPDVNEYGIGICLVGDFENAPPTSKQVAAGRALVAYLGDRYKIAADHTETHSHLAANPTACPGKMFPTQAILGSSSVALR